MYPGSGACNGSLCAAGKYGGVGSTSAATATCTDCPSNADAPEGSAACACNAGYTGPNGGPCSACPAGAYKATPGVVVSWLICGLDAHTHTTSDGRVVLALAA